MHVFWIFLEFRPPLVLDYACLTLWIDLPYHFDYVLDFFWITFGSRWPPTTGARSLLAVALSLLPSREEAASEARVLVQLS